MVLKLLFLDERFAADLAFVFAVTDMSADMFGHISLRKERPLTELAFPPLEPQMRVLMHPEVGSTPESLSALIALERSDIRVYDHMRGQVSFDGILLATYVALKGSLPLMGPDVRCEASLVGQHFAAELTFEWFDSGMGLVVSLQIAFASEGLSALFAHEVLGLVVDLNVLVELRLRYEAFGTDRALEGTFRIVVNAFHVIVERRLIEQL